MAITAAKLLIYIGSDTKEAEAGLKRIDSQLDGFGRKAQDIGSKLSMFVTAPLLGVGAASYKIAADFDRNMNVLRVQSGATSEEISRLGELAEELGADLTLPGTSAADAAEAMLEMSKAGLSITDTMQSAKGVLQLSAAGALSNAKAAEITANALNAFHLEGKEATRVADLLAASANASSGEVVDMADALKMVAAVAYSANVPIEDIVTAISMMANAGIQGSDAGTSLKQMILSLQAPTAKASSLMKELGISIYDVQGNMLPMEQIIANFSGALSGLSQEQRNAALATIFGSDAVRAANVVLMAGADAFDQMRDAVTDSGAAAELAGAQMEGLPGVIENIRSSLETALLKGIEPFKEDIIEMGTAVAEAIGAFAELDEQTRKNIVSIGLIAAGAGPAIWGIGTLARGIGALAVALRGAALATTAFTGAWTSGLTLTTSLQVALGAIPVTLGAIAMAAGAVVAVWATWNDKIAETNKEGAEAVATAWEKFFQDQVAAGKSATEILDEYMQAQARVRGVLEDTNPVLRMFIQNQDQLTGGFGELSEVMASRATSLDEYVSGLRKAAEAQGLLIDEQGNLYRMGAINKEIVQRNYLNAAQFEAKRRTEELTEQMERRRGVTERLAAADQAEAEALAAAMTEAADAETILASLNQALANVGWTEEQVKAASDALAIGLGTTSEATVQLQNDINLITAAFAEHVISADELTSYMLQAKEGTLELTGAERAHLSVATEHAAALRENAEAAKSAASQHLALAQSLKDATDAQIAQAMIRSLQEALDAGDLELPDFVTAVSGIQESFGLADEESRRLAEGIGILTGALTNGKIPAEEMDEALKTLISDAQDGVVDWEGLMAQYTTASLTMGEDLAGGFSETKIEFLLLVQDAQTSSDKVAAAFTEEDWSGVGASIGEGVAAGISLSTPQIEAAARLAAKLALEAAMEELEIKSPSAKAARLVGLPMMQGMAQGIIDNANLPVRAMANVSAAAVQNQTVTNNNLQVDVKANMSRELDLFVLAREVAEAIREYNL